MTGFASSSIFSLNPSYYLSFFVPSGFLLPPAITLLIFKVNDNIGQNQHYVSLVLGAVWIYCISQNKQVRKDLINSITFEESLIKANIELLQSQKKLEEETAKTIHASRLASLGEMASGMAHEINNPLAIIQGMAESIKISAIQENNTKTLNYTEKIIKSVARISNIIKGLRSLSRTDEHDHLESVSINEILNETLSFYDERFKSNLININLKNNTDFMVNCVPVQISQIFINLINNSIDAIKNNDEKWIEIETTADPSYVFMLFKDSGTGLTDRAKEKIFQPFFTEKETGQGTGLGLSISRSLIRKHSGDLVYLDNQANTTFLLKIPRSLK